MNGKLSNIFFVHGFVLYLPVNCGYENIFLTFFQFLGIAVLRRCILSIEKAGANLESRIIKLTKYSALWLLCSAYNVM